MEEILKWVARAGALGQNLATEAVHQVTRGIEKGLKLIPTGSTPASRSGIVPQDPRGGLSTFFHHSPLSQKIKEGLAGLHLGIFAGNLRNMNLYSGISQTVGIALESAQAALFEPRPFLLIRVRDAAHQLAAAMRHYGLGSSSYAFEISLEANALLRALQGLDLLFRLQGATEVATAGLRTAKIGSDGELLLQLVQEFRLASPEKNLPRLDALRGMTWGHFARSIDPNPDRLIDALNTLQHRARRHNDVFFRNLSEYGGRGLGLGSVAVLSALQGLAILVRGGDAQSRLGKGANILSSFLMLGGALRIISQWTQPHSESHLSRIRGGIRATTAGLGLNLVVEGSERLVRNLVAPNKEVHGNSLAAATAQTISGATAVYAASRPAITVRPSIFRANPRMGTGLVSLGFFGLSLFFGQEDGPEIEFYQAITRVAKSNVRTVAQCGSFEENKVECEQLEAAVLQYLDWIDPWAASRILTKLNKAAKLEHPVMQVKLFRALNKVPPELRGKNLEEILEWKRMAY